MSREKVAVLRAAAQLIRDGKRQATCTAIAQAEQGCSRRYLRPGPVQRFWGRAHKPRGVCWGTMWFGSEYDGDSNYLRHQMLDELALCLEVQGFA